MYFKVFDLQQKSREEKRTLRFLTNSMAATVYLYLLAYSLFLCLCLGSNYGVCNEIPHECGELHFRYPFGLKNSGCGDPDFQLQCDQQSGNFLIDIGGDEYRILRANNNTMTIANNNLWSDKCNLSGNYSQFWLPTSRFHIAADTYTNLTIWGLCDKSTEEIPELRHGKLCGDDWHYSIQRPEEETRCCKPRLQLPIHKKHPHIVDFQILLQEGFEVSWQVDPDRVQICDACLNSFGYCGYDIFKPTTFLCHCPDGTSNPDKCSDNEVEVEVQDREDRNMSVIVTGYFVAGVVVTVIAVALVLFTTYDTWKGRNPPAPQLQLQGNGNDMANPPQFSSAQESSLFTSTQKSSSLEIGV